MDGDRITAYRLTDYMIASVILNSDGISGVTNEDGVGFIIPDLVNEFWVGINHENHGIVGCYRLHPIGLSLWQVHANILLKYREYSKQYSIEFLKWTVNNILELKVIICYIPECYPNVIGHVKNLGFNLIGTIPKSFTKNSIEVDQLIYCINKQFIKETYDG